MSDDTIRCSSCGYLNPAGSTACWRCNFPLVPDVPAAAPAEPGLPRPVRPIRPRRPQRQQPLQLQLWLVVGAMAALLVIFTAVKGFHQTNFAPVAGAKPEQQKLVDQMRERLQKDSLDVEARITLADVLYDTGNWQEAAANYEVGARLEPHRASTFVDMGVCYFNMGNSARAEELFKHALEVQPDLAQALFNLGIVYEQRRDSKTALDYYHRAARANPPPPMQEALQQAMQRVMPQAGGAAPPMPPGK